MKATLFGVNAPHFLVTLVPLVFSNLLSAQQPACPFPVTNTTNCVIKIEFEVMHPQTPPPGGPCFYCPAGCGPWTQTISANTTVNLLTTCCNGANNIVVRVIECDGNPASTATVNVEYNTCFGAFPNSSGWSCSGCSCLSGAISISTSGIIIN